MQEIKKFKNGKIAFRLDKKLGYYYDSNGDLNEKYYHDVMNMSDLYFNQINGYMYLVDFNTKRVYEVEHFAGAWSLPRFLETVQRVSRLKRAYYLLPVGKVRAKQLLKDLENGF